MSNNMTQLKHNNPPTPSSHLLNLYSFSSLTSLLHIGCLYSLIFLCHQRQALFSLILHISINDNLQIIYIRALIEDINLPNTMHHYTDPKVTKCLTCVCVYKGDHTRQEEEKVLEGENESGVGNFGGCDEREKIGFFIVTRITVNNVISTFDLPPILLFN
ncbi:hypothetical protein S83_007755 [Arachis hypogaea]